ncbi:autophagy 8i, putative [Perkinsus marinus ATCC 50983]|uniref:Autophagy-related protein n=1 Tax=Perkinsus marinus (strain ATCC 50983 / TXsc) TaxID=423536 RepID=C5KSC4_PERM5|nr:autophagy 8i, putative [Perkinsus marinus ATCC 50983]EER12614.1 autophagy 8i, putative [Perkinsus marinus ATCC 50983]|eukprot:XP_002780819.1 autophagy 8i, putative [Perkinsus marinus ATCC 50983]
MPSNSTPMQDSIPFDRRLAEARRILQKYPDRVPVIVEKAERSDLPEIEKKKFLVPGTMLCGEFKYIVHKHITQAVENGNGSNPEDWTRKATANFLRSQKIDPYILEQADLENWRRWFMTEVQYFAGDREKVSLKERIEKARELAATKHQAKLDKLRRHYPLGE